jgi:membrane-associated phospholipid phosphatase
VPHAPTASDPRAPGPLSERDRRYALANALSYVVNPLVLPPVGFGVILWHFGAPAAEVAWVVTVALVFFCLLPLGYLFHAVRSGRVESIEIRRREERLRPFLVGIASYAMGVGVLAVTGQTVLPLLIVLALLFPLNTALVLLVNLRFKISIHMTGLAGFVSILLFVALLVSDALPPREGSALRLATVSPLLALVPLLMWARVRVGAHTPAEVAAGAAFGLVVPFVELTVILRALGLT